VHQKIDETVIVVTSEEGDGVIEIAKWITLSGMKAKFDSGEDKVIKLEQHSTSSEANSNSQEKGIGEVEITRCRKLENQTSAQLKKQSDDVSLPQPGLN